MEPTDHGLRRRKKARDVSGEHIDSPKPLESTSETNQPAEEHPSSSIDRFLDRFNKFFTNAANQDKGLKLVQWTLWFLSQFYKTKPLQKVSSEISMARFILRFFGLPDAVQAIRTGGWEDRRTRMGTITGKIMVLSMLGYYPLEHVAYIKWTSPELLPASLQGNRISMYSCRCWFIYLVAEIAQSISALQFLYRSKENLLADTSTSQKLTPINKNIQYTRLQLIRSGLFTLPCLHWSLPSWDTHPWLSEQFANTLMWLESIVSIYQATR